MKNIFYYFLLSGLVFATFSCNDDIPQTLQGEYIALDGSKTSLTFLRVNDGLAKDAGIQTKLIAVAKSSPVNYNFEILPTSTAQAGTHYTVGSTSGTIASGEYVGNLPISILPDNINPGEVWTLDIKLTSADLTLASDKASTFKIQVSCPSTLAGTFEASSTGTGGVWNCTDTWTGTVEWELVGNNDYNVYSSDANNPRSLDYSMGGYWACYGDGATLPSDDTAGDLLINDICGKLSYTGASRWGEIYSFNNITANGTSAIFDWTNDYGESAVTTLVRTDGKDWPNLSF